MRTKIAIQGIKGSFHHQVVNEYFPKDVEIDECLSFEELIDSLVTGKSDQAVMAIENSIAGPIIPNYALIDKNNLHIIGEHYLDIHQNLMSFSKANLQCAAVATSVPINNPVSALAFFNHFKPISPTPSNPPGRVLGFQIPALKTLTSESFNSCAIFNTCSSVSALQGPAITNG